MKTNAFFVCVVGINLMLVGCATNNASPTSEAASAKSKATVVREVPTLKVVTDCGACQVRADIPELILESYADAVAKAGAKVMPDAHATLTIKEYGTRDGTARFLADNVIRVLAGAKTSKDEMKATVTYENRTFSVEEYYVNALQGIKSVARSIGSQAFDKLSE